MMEMEENSHNVKWLLHTKNMLDIQRSIHLSKTMYDCIISTGENRFKAHQLILSASSDFFMEIFKTCPEHLTKTIIIPDINSNIIESILMFIYTGEVFVNAKSLSSFLDACSFLKIKGLISHECFINGVRLEQKSVHHNNIINEHNNNQHQQSMSANEAASMNVIEYADNQQSHEHSPSEYSEFVLSEIVEEHDGNNVKSIENVNIEIIDEVQDEQEDDEKTTELDIQENTQTDIFDDKNNSSAATMDNSSYIYETEIKDDDDEDDYYDNCDDNVDMTTASTTSKQHHDHSAETSYEDDALISALEDLTNGKTVNEVAQEYDVPQLAIYRKLRYNSKYRNLYRQVRHEVITAAVNAVNVEGLSLQNASTKYALSKTVLWRNLKKTSLYKPEEKVHAFRSDAIAALQRGETLSCISKKYNIPLSTLHRDKVRLYTQGKLPKNCTIRKRDGGPDFQNRLKAAMNCCERGLSQKVASEMHNIPKTTIWRYMRYNNRRRIKQDANNDEETDKNDLQHIIVEKLDSSECADE